MTHVTVPDAIPDVTYSVVGSTTGPFTIPFVFTAKEDVKVAIGGVLLDAALWTLGGSLITGGYQTGTCTLAAAVANTTVRIYRDIPASRTTDFASGPLPKDALNTALDRLTMHVQDLELALRRTLRIRDGETLAELPLGKTASASGFIATDASGNPVIASGMASVPVTPAMAAPLAASTIAAGRAALGINVSDNRIINGRMEIDQRNAGAAVTINATAQTYTIDRWLGVGQAADGVFTVQRQSGGPAGFPNFLRATVTTADASIGASQIYVLCQKVEGAMISDLAWGSASAAAVTLRFWVRSTTLGTYSGSVMNAAANRTYPFTFTINAPNTWELKSVTIPGDTTGTWLTDTGVGLQLWLDLGTGTSGRATAGAWAAGAFYGATGATSLISTLSATLDITGVELVRASSDLGPSWRPFAQELALCQRYAHRIGGVATFDFLGLGFVAGTNQADLAVTFPVRMRAVPALTVGSATGFQVNDGGVTPSSTGAALSGAINNTVDHALVALTGLAGLTIGRVCRVYANGTTNGWMLFSAEL